MRFHTIESVPSDIFQNAVEIKISKQIDLISEAVSTIAFANPINQKKFFLRHLLSRTQATKINGKLFYNHRIHTDFEVHKTEGYSLIFAQKTDIKKGSGKTLSRSNKQ